MTLEDLGNIGDFVGGIAVILTLIYLAIQIRQNTAQIAQNGKIVKASAHQDYTALVHNFNSRLAADREFAELWLKARDGIGDLDEIDRLRFTTTISSLFRLFENHHHLVEAGLIDPDQFAGYRRIMLGHLSRAGTREAWSLISMMFSNEFQSSVSAMINEQGRNEGMSQPRSIF
jgi:hypothetical protein